MKFVDQPMLEEKLKKANGVLESVSKKKSNFLEK
jgi:hypothetical protein